MVGSVGFSKASTKQVFIFIFLLLRKELLSQGSWRSWERKFDFQGFRIKETSRKGSL